MSSGQSIPGQKVPLVGPHARAEVWALGAAIHHLTFRFADGHMVQPLAEAPWHDDTEITADDAIAPHLRYLGGEWPCVPFGRSAADPVPHGFGTDNLWTCLENSKSFQRWRIEYPEDRDIAAVERAIRFAEDDCAVEFSLSVDPRRDCVMPVGLHPIVRLPNDGERFEVQASFEHGETFPVVFETGVSQLKPAVLFDQLDELSLQDGGSIAFADLCRLQTEEALQLMAADGWVVLSYPDAGYRLRILWDKNAFSTCLFWLSAGGRMAKPWGGRFRGLGVEPLEARFIESQGQGAIAGGRQFFAGKRWTTSYRVGVEDIRK